MPQFICLHCTNVFWAETSTICPMCEKPLDEAPSPLAPPIQIDGADLDPQILGPKDKLSKTDHAISMLIFFGMLVGILGIALSGVSSLEKLSVSSNISFSSNTSFSATGRALSSVSSLDNPSGHLYAWDLLLGIMILAASLVLARIKSKRLLVAYLAIIILTLTIIPILKNFGYVTGRRSNAAFGSLFFSVIAIVVVAAIIRFLPSKLIGLAIIIIGLTSPFGMFGLIDFDLFWRQNVGLRLLSGLTLLTIGIILYWRSSNPALLSRQNIARRRIIWFPAIVLYIILLSYLLLFGGPEIDRLKIGQRYTSKGRVINNNTVLISSEEYGDGNKIEFAALLDVDLSGKGTEITFDGTVENKKMMEGKDYKYSPSGYRRAIVITTFRYVVLKDCHIH